MDYLRMLSRSVSDAPLLPMSFYPPIGPYTRRLRLAAMTKARTSHLPVLEGNKLVEVISFYDVAKACLREANFENSLLKRYIKNWPEQES